MGQHGLWLLTMAMLVIRVKKDSAGYNGLTRTMLVTIGKQGSTKTMLVTFM